MNTSFYHAKLTSENTINIMIFTQLVRQSDDIYFFLVKDSKIVERCSPNKCTSVNNVRFFEIRLISGYEYGHHYEIFLPHFGSIPVDVSDAIYFDSFDDKFYYDGDDLGATYTKDFTAFALWAPLASSVSVTLYLASGAVTYDMHRGEKGVYRCRVYGDYRNVPYQYIVTNSEIARKVNDPYGKGLTLNSEYSAVVDLDSIKKEIPFVNSNLNKTLQESSIYELSIRDFTIDSHTDIVNKGKFLGLIEKGRKTNGGNPAGLDYLKFLGVSHVQFLPILDFGNVLDDNPDKIYNWGYDVTHYFGIEGSYSCKPEIPSERILELRKTVAALHKENIGVIIDVVYNHIYSYESSIYEKILPGFFFRKSKDGRMYNGSGCGNDIASERPMVRKMIVDSTIWLLEMFDIDGLRFDLMGLLDIKTVLAIKEAMKKRKPTFFIYGEGWHISTGIPGDTQASIPNAFKMPEIGFFNDAYRDIVKGSTFDLAGRGYASGDYSYSGGMIYALMGTVVNYIYPRRFIDAGQSVNYIECHDNATLYDKFTYSLPEEDEETILKRIKMANSLVGFSFGVPFYHMGQEIGLDKHMEDNTYNMGDEYNKMDYSLLDKRFEMARYLKEVLKFRNNVSIYKTINHNEISQIVRFEQKDFGVIRIYFKLTDNSDALMIVNPSNQTLYYELDDYYKLIFSNGCITTKDIYMKHITHSPFSLIWLLKKRGEK